MKTKSKKIKTAADLDFATKEDMYQWIEDCPKLGGAWLKFKPRPSWSTLTPKRWNEVKRFEFTKQLCSMNKDGLKVLIRAVMSA